MQDKSLNKVAMAISIESHKLQHLLQHETMIKAKNCFVYFHLVSVCAYFPAIDYITLRQSLADSPFSFSLLLSLHYMARWTLTGLQEGMTYAIQGITIVLQNPNIRKERFLKIFIYLSMVSFILLGLTNVLIAIPIHVVRFILWFSSSDKASQADDALESANRFVREIVASVPLLALLFMRYVYPKPLDDLFMESLRYLDSTHPDRAPYASILAQQKFKRRYWADMKEYMLRTWKKVRLGLLLLLLSMIPFVGRFVFPAAGRVFGDVSGFVRKLMLYP